MFHLAISLILVIIFILSNNPLIYASKEIPDNLALISINQICSKPNNLPEEQFNRLKNCLRIIKDGSNNKIDLAQELEELSSIGTDGAFAIPVLVWLFRRNDHMSDLASKMILQMGQPAIPYLRKALNSRFYDMTTRIKLLLYELDTENQDKYFNELIQATKSVNAQERRIAMYCLSKIRGIDKVLANIYIEALTDEEDQITNEAGRYLSDHVYSLKSTLMNELQDSNPLKSVRIIKILWITATHEEQNFYTNTLLSLIPRASEKERRVITSTMLAYGITDIPQITDEILNVLNDRDFLKTNWHIFVTSNNNDVSLISILHSNKFYAKINALLILSKRNQYSPVFNSILISGLKSNDLEIVKHTVTVLSNLFGYVGDDENTDINEYNFYDLFSLISLIKSYEYSFACDLFLKYLDNLSIVNEIENLPDIDINDLNPHLNVNTMQHGNNSLDIQIHPEIISEDFILVQSFIHEKFMREVVFAFNLMKSNLNFYLENSSQIFIPERSETQIIFDHLLSKNIFTYQNGIMVLNKDINKEEKLDVEWINILLLNQIYSGIFNKRPSFDIAARYRYQNLMEPLADLLGKEEKLAQDAGYLLKTWGQKAEQVLVEKCNSQDPILALRANGFLFCSKNIIDKTPHINAIRMALNSRNSKLREVATDILLTTISPLPKHTIPLLIEALGLERRNSERVNVALRYAGKEALPYLKEALNHKNPKIATMVMGILARNYGNKKEFVPLLGEAFAKGNHQVKIAAVKALEDIGPDAIAAAHFIIPGLGSDRQMEHRCKTALKYMGEGVVDTLIEYGITSKNEKVALISHDMLVRFGVNREKNILPLLNIIKDTNHPLRAVALRELADLGELANDATDYLIEMIEALQGRDKETAIWALSLIASGDTRTINLLLKYLEDPNSRIKATACHCLGGFGPKAKAAIPTLERLAKEGHGSVRSLAKEALKNIKKGLSSPL